jgi:hypothetical protein
MFWARFQELCTPGPDLLCMVCSHLSDAKRKALRGVNRFMRRAMNATVTRLSWRGDSLAQLHEVFPNLSSLSLRAVGEHFSVEECRACLQRLASSNATLLAMLAHLRLTVPTAAAAADSSALWELVDRCAIGGVVMHSALLTGHPASPSLVVIVVTAGVVAVLACFAVLAHPAWTRQGA